MLPETVRIGLPFGAGSGAAYATVAPTQAESARIAPRKTFFAFEMNMIRPKITVSSYPNLQPRVKLYLKVKCKIYDHHNII
jgi:hypothetical protein